MENIKKIVNSKVEQLIALGGFVKEYKSIWKLALDDRDFRFFNNQEDDAVKNRVVYNRTGSNPAESKNATIVAFGFELLNPDEEALDLSAGSTSYLRHASATKFLNQLQYVFKQNTTNLREGFVSKIHEPIPRIMKPMIIGSGIANHVATVTASEIQGKNIEHKNQKHALFLPIELTGNSDVLEISAFIPSGGYKVDAPLAGCELVLHALSVEFPNAKKQITQKPPTR
jgi:hypothetical protein